MNIKEMVFNQIKELTKVPFDEKSIIRDLKIDSLDLVILVSKCEEQFQISITDDELMNLKTVGDVIKLIGQKIS
ncbi:acyl carrier protein [Metamycoplasma subdolum]|uniref:Acyl carrier protein n=1 Tax=Metamycoplasma subdolum TaxID=92407 RepID=A0A3M0A6X1_9BACT|nr:phosphopantetheine-binding protein [Metamycoplasma subdolum]RMA78558.1 acyl carrier protein [Metamycoplasma subdolum]WPB50303.1 phosphopantetheine-binding protein [Metamycoplasma subdolum]